MEILINHCWCSDSNHGGVYLCRCILSISRIEKGKTYYDPPMEDWIRLLYKHEGVRKLKPEVFEWLSNNIPDDKWAVGTDAYNRLNELNFYIFFQSSRDALKFIKHWSVFKKPLHYLNYFTDNRREFDPKTKTLRKVKKT